MNIYLDKLELYGFKSFPDKTTIKFHKGITAVIGPNGCGKSNIVDAVLWVLGEQRIKNLRGENSEDLIFNGSADKKPLGMTEVGAHFIKNQEPVYIARRYYRSAETKYILNEKYCRNKDIQNTLYDMQMGEKKYFIFEQGSIDKLVSLKAGEKRILIEEAAGISQYLERKKETVNKLIIAEQNLENLEILIFDKESRLKELKNQVNYAQRYRNLKRDKMDDLKALIEKKYRHIQTEVKKSISLKESEIKKETGFLTQIKEFEKNGLELEERKWNIDLKLKKLAQEKFNQNSRIISLQKEIEKAGQKKEFISQRTVDLNGEIKENNRESDGLSPLLESKRQALASMEVRLRESSDGDTEEKQNVDKLKDRLQSEIEKESKIRAEIFQTRSGLSSEKNELNKIEKEIIIHENELKNRDAQYREIKLDELKKRLESETAELTTLKNSLQEAKSGSDRLNEEKKRGESELKETRERLNETQSDITSMEKQIARYQEIKTKMTDTVSAASDGPAPLLLQDQITADPKHFSGLENFYHDEMDAKIVESFEQFESLSGNKFMLLRREMPNVAEKEREIIRNSPGFISFTDELFTTEPSKIKESLKQGVLTETLKQAFSIHLKFAVPVMTLKGEIIDANGMVFVKRDRGILNINAEIKHLEKTVESARNSVVKLETELDSRQKAFQEIENACKAAVQKINGIEQSLYKKESLIQSEQSQYERNKKRKDRYESEITMLKQDIEKQRIRFEDKKQRVAEAEKKEQEITRGSETLKESIAELKEKINETEKAYLQKQHRVNVLKQEIKSARNEIDSTEQRKVRIKKVNEDNRLKLEELEKERIQIDRSIDGYKSELSELDGALKDIEKTIREENDIFQKLATDIKNNSEKMNLFRKELEQSKESKGQAELVLSGLKKDLFQLEDLALKELNEELPKIKGAEENLTKDIEELESNIRTYDDRLSKMRDSDKLNFSAESEYELLEKDFGFLLGQKEDVIKSIEDMHQAIEKIDSESKVSFLKAFNEIKENFVRNFKILFEGGDATIQLSDQSNLLETGLEIKAQPPGKKLLGLRLLSGGEKTLTSLAFLFSLFQYKPAPFCVFDEVDASLDEANIQRFLKFLHILKRNTQFLIITHNFKTMEEADYLYGISMNDPGISTVYSTKMTNGEIEN